MKWGWQIGPKTQDLLGFKVIFRGADGENFVILACVV